MPVGNLYADRRHNMEAACACMATAESEVRVTEGEAAASIWLQYLGIPACKLLCDRETLPMARR